jgi:acetyltransferase-like isoleucine patch superfamily enzyme
MLIKNSRIPVLSILTIGLLPSFLKIAVYKLYGYKIGKRVKIRFGSVLIGERISIGNNTQIGYFSIISCKECVVKANVEIGTLVYMKVDKIFIGNQTVIRENNQFGGMDIGKSELKIGDMSHIHQGCFINTTLPVIIGNKTAIGGGSYLFTHSSWQSILDGYPCTFASIEIGDNVWISWNVFILPSVKIGDGTLVSAGAIVTKNLPDKCLASGNPAKPVIPSRLFPREPHPDEKKEIVYDIINKFGEYIVNNDFFFRCQKGENLDKYTVDDKKGNKHSIYFVLNSTTNIESIEFTKNDLVLFFTGSHLDLTSLVKKEGIAILDLQSGLSYGNNSVSKELIKFFKHYGIRFLINNTKRM